MRILVFNDHFFPAKKAGGIVQSIHNIITLLGDQLEFYIVCSALEFGTEQELDVPHNQWTDYNGVAKVMYQTKEHNSISTIREIINDLNPDSIYLNGIFSLPFVIKPLFAIGKKFSFKLIIAPRGMLQSGALAIKPLKKKIYLALFKWIAPIDKMYWHATDHTEFNDIAHVFSESNIYFAPVLPLLIEYKHVSSRFVKIESDLKICTISLITAKKGIEKAILALKHYKTTRKISYDIYGPIKDKIYWDECISHTQNLPSNLNISYKGAIDPVDVKDVLSEYHLYLLPTAGENFGHSIFEALASGTPILISSHTPFIKTSDREAGWIADSVEEIQLLIDVICGLDGEKLNQISLNARNYAVSVFSETNYIQLYRKLFVGNESN